MTYTWDQLNGLLDACGGAAYILRLDLFRENVCAFHRAFRKHYTNTSLGYSYKTNYLPALCIEANHLSLYAEVVSGMEYEIARTCGVQHDRIIFNGPVKSEAELTTALTGGALVNIDNMQEVERVVKVCQRHANQPFQVGLRCHFQLNDARESRFGLNDENGDLQRAAQRLRATRNATLSGLHCHFSFDRSATSYRVRTLRMLKLVNQVFPDQPPRFIDLGGGFCGPMPTALRQQVGEAPSYEEYAQQIGPLVADRFGSDARTELILEPGVGLVGNVMQFVCRVESVKQLATRRIAVTTGSYQNIKPGISSYNLPIEVYRRDTTCQIQSSPTDLVGYTCMEDDTIYYAYPDVVNVGDIVVLSNVGAYSLVFKPPFIRPMPAVVMHDDDEVSWRVLRKPQTVSDLLIGYTVQEQADRL